MLLAGTLSGCVTLPRTSFTADQQATAAPADFSHVRYNEGDPALADMLRATLQPDEQGDVNTLAISGGGANGAYGAGLLYGWDKAGNRPPFQLVTGISAGAMAAPFAFVGSKWDEELRQTYFTGQTHSLLQSRGLLSLLTPGLYSKAPLEGRVRAFCKSRTIFCEPSPPSRSKDGGCSLQRRISIPASWSSGTWGRSQRMAGLTLVASSSRFWSPRPACRVCSRRR